ncbi:ArsR/SmtB family transcription factor [Ollibium composti]|uniref:Helix-turn-helix transcriptional regulator n=1 Tax=Ollibium composti TaxID=2675109 RepID=A0ABY2Q4V0_9HYPH|nr:helix-turn-helix transcriptional regulator [Mesorhizobium composti]THF56006.1 helix-turn-helix transcriptional regulator [Mesorhizobium composti]
MNPQHPDVDQISLSNVLAALGDPTRLAIVAELARKGDGPVSCSHFLMFTSKTNLSYHLAKLREAGVTRTEVSGTSRFTTLRRADLDQRFPDLLASVITGASTADESEAQTT